MTDSDRGANPDSRPSQAAPALTPDTKDWTWVLREPCPECGFDAGQVRPRRVATALRPLAQRWVVALGRDDAGTRATAAWSTLEYGAHVRDVCRIFGERLALMLELDDPEFANWDQDATAIAERYDRQDPRVVAGELSGAAAVTADRFDAVPDHAWLRTGRRSNGSRFTVETLGTYFLHDVVHHLHDVGA